MHLQTNALSLTKISMKIKEKKTLKKPLLIQSRDALPVLSPESIMAARRPTLI